METLGMGERDMPYFRNGEEILCNIQLNFLGRRQPRQYVKVLRRFGN